MADFDSSLPIRTENNADVVAALADATVTTQTLGIDAAGLIGAKIYASNGDALTDTTGWLNVNISGSSVATAIYADKSTFTYGTSNEGVVAGVFQDTSPTLTAGQTGSLRLNAQRGLHVELRSAAGASLLGQAAMAASIPVVIASDQSKVNVQPTDGTNSQSFTAAGEAKVSVTQPLPTGTNTIGKVDILDGAGNPLTSQANGGQRALDVGIDVAGVQIDPRQIRTLTTTDQIKVNIQDSSGAAFTSSNPLFVTDVGAAGTPKFNYQTTAALAAGATASHTYTITALKTFNVRKVWAAGSGKIKVVFRISPDGSTYSTVFVGYNSTADANVDWNTGIAEVIESGTGSTLQVQITNDDKQAFDVHSTIVGSEV